jgi:integration host factor subunit beta
MNKPDLIDVVAHRRNISLKRSEEVIGVIFDCMAGALSSGDRIEIRGFGSFTVREYQARTGRNPMTGALMDVKPRKAPFFKVGKELREKLAKS